MKFNFSDIELAFEFVSGLTEFEHAAMLCKDTGEIYYSSDYSGIDEIPEEAYDREGCIEIPHKNDLDLGSRLVFEFVERHLPKDIDHVRHMFRSKGAYGRFKGFLEDQDMLEMWYDFEDQRKSTALKAWCQDNEIELN